jgi:hypothetical protein
MYSVWERYSQVRSLCCQLYQKSATRSRGQRYAPLVDAEVVEKFDSFPVRTGHGILAAVVSFGANAIALPGIAFLA